MSRKLPRKIRKPRSITPMVLPRVRPRFPHASYGVPLPAPDYIEPFTGYRVWQWDADGVKSLNHAKWTPGEAFEATCRHAGGGLSLSPYMSSDEAQKHEEYLAELRQQHLVPNADCTCGMYAGINLEHLINIGYAAQGMHGPVSLWGRVEPNSLGYRAQYAYPKHFIVPHNMFPFSIREIESRMKVLQGFKVDVYIETGFIGGEKLPLWIADYGWSQQGWAFLIDQRTDWYIVNLLPGASARRANRRKVGDY